MWMMGGVGGEVFGNLDEDIVVHVGHIAKGSSLIYYTML